MNYRQVASKKASLPVFAKIVFLLSGEFLYLRDINKGVKRFYN